MIPPSLNCKNPAKVLFAFLLSLSLMISSPAYSSGEDDDLSLTFIAIAEAVTGLSDISSMIMAARLVEVGDECRLAHYRFFPKWDGDARSALPDDEVIEVLCRKSPENSDWSCSVKEITRDELSYLTPPDVSCDA